MITVNEMLKQAALNDNKLLAHMLYLAVTKGYTTLDADAETIDDALNRLNKDEVLELTNKNILKIDVPRLIAVKRDKEWFYYLSDSLENAQKKHANAFGEAKRAVDVTHKIDTKIILADNSPLSSAVSFRQMAAQIPRKQFPVLVCRLGAR